MGKLRLNLQDMMPHGWYRRLKLELGNHGKYKRWSSQRSLSASKKLLKASPLNTLHADAATQSSGYGESDSAERETQERDAPLHAARRAPEQQETSSSHTQRKTLFQEERENASTLSHAEQEGPSQEERETHFAAPKTHHAHSLSSAAMSNKLRLSPLSNLHVERECPQHEERETHVGASNTIHLLMQQAPSLSSPHPFTEKSFHLNLQELEARLKALNTQERRVYYSSSILTGAVPTPQLIDSNGFQGMHADSPVTSPFEAINAARKLFCDEVKPLSYEGSRSSHGSASFTGLSITSSEDTAFDKASSSLWDWRDRSSLTSEGSELFPAIDEFENTLNSLRRRARRVRRDVPAKQKRRQKDAASKVLHAIDDDNCIHDAVFCTDTECPCEADGKSLNSSLQTPWKSKYKMAAMGLGFQTQEASQSMQEQGECVLDTHMHEGDDSLVDRSFSSESFTLDSLGRQPFSPCYYADCDKLSPIQCSDSAVSESESYESLPRQVHQDRSGSESIGLFCKQGLLSEKATIEASLPYNDVYREVLQHTGTSFDAESGLDSLSGTYGSSYSNVCDCHNNLLLSEKVSLEAKPSRLPLPKSRDTCRRRYDIASLSDLARSALADVNSELSSSSYSACTRRASNGSPFDNQIDGYLKSPSTWRTPDDIPCDIGSRLQVLKSGSKKSAEANYDGDRSAHSYNGTVGSLLKSNSKREIDGNENFSAASLSKGPGTLRMFNVSPYNSEKKVPLLTKSATKRSFTGDSDVNGGLKGQNSALLRAKSYAYREGDSYESASLSRRELHDNECSGMASMYTRKTNGIECHSIEGCNSVESMCKGVEGYGYHGVEARSKRGVDGYGWSIGESIRRRGIEEYGLNSVGSMSKRGGEGYESNVSAASLSKSSGKREGEGGKESNRGVKRDEGKKAKAKEGIRGQHNWYKGGLRVVREGERKEKSKVYESFAMVKCSENPIQDFKESMMDMISHKKLHESMDLVELLHCFLSLNSPRYHDTIVKAFIDLWSHFYSPSP